MFSLSLDEPPSETHLLNMFSSASDFTLPGGSTMTAAPIELVFIPYIAIAIALTFWVARALTRNGEVFLRDVFPQNHALADALNRLLAIGFYLVNLGWGVPLGQRG